MCHKSSPAKRMQPSNANVVRPNEPPAREVRSIFLRGCPSKVATYRPAVFIAIETLGGSNGSKNMLFLSFSGGRGPLLAGFLRGSQKESRCYCWSQNKDGTPGISLAAAPSYASAARGSARSFVWPHRPRPPPGGAGRSRSGASPVEPRTTGGAGYGVQKQGDKQQVAFAVCFFRKMGSHQLLPRNMGFKEHS